MDIISGNPVVDMLNKSLSGYNQYLWVINAELLEEQK